MIMPEPTIAVTINGSTRQVAPGLTIPGLLESLGLDSRLVVVEHNRVILERARLPEVEVRAGDNLEVVHFVGGG
jgi:thiamine biosynthesis protein ThiS